MFQSLLPLTGILDMMPDAIIIVDGDGRIMFANAAVIDQFGYTPGELQRKQLERLIPESCRAQHRFDFAEFREHGRPTIMAHRPVIYGLNKDGEHIPLSISIANLELDGELYSIAVIRDGGDVQSEITEVKYQAETDPLSGLANRLRFSRKVAAAIGDDRPFGLLFLDLEKFKPINDHYGHDAGDSVLKIVASRLQSMVRAQDLAVRLGGDEFLLVFDALQSRDTLEKRAATVAESVTREFHVDKLIGSIGVNIGGALFPRDGNSEEALLKVADRNMYHAKQSGKAYHIE